MASGVLASSGRMPKSAAWILIIVAAAMMDKACGLVPAPPLSGSVVEPLIVDLDDDVPVLGVELLELVFADDPRFQFSNVLDVDQFSFKTIFTRISFGDDVYAFNFAPGVRISFTASAPRIDIGLSFEGNFDTAGQRVACSGDPFSRPEGGCGVVIIEVDSEREYSFNGDDILDDVWLRLRAPSDGTHNYTVILPYQAPVSLLGLQVYAQIGLESETAGVLDSFVENPNRPRLVCFGDSITQGAMATNIYNAYPSILQRRFDAEVINLGFGGRRVVPADALVLSSIEADAMVVMIGTNELFDVQLPGELEARYTQFLTNLRSTSQSPQPFLFIITPTWSFGETQRLLDDGLTMPEIRSIIISAVDTFVQNTGDDRIVVLDGLALITPTTSFFPDALHPNNQGFFQMADVLTTTISSIPSLSDVFVVIEQEDETFEPPQPPLPPGSEGPEIPDEDLECQVSQWSEWTPCTQTCGESVSQRSRSVTNLDFLATQISSQNPLDCPPLIETEPCPIRPPCPLCAFTEWSEWSACDVNCGSGSRTRYRDFIAAWALEAFEEAGTEPTGIVDDFCQGFPEGFIAAQNLVEEGCCLMGSCQDSALDVNVFFPDPVLVFEQGSFTAGWTAFSWNSIIVAPDVSPPVTAFAILANGELNVIPPADQSPSVALGDEDDFFVGTPSLHARILPTGGIWILNGEVDAQSDEIFFNEVVPSIPGQTLPLQVGWLAFWIQAPDSALQGLTIDVTYAFEASSGGSDDVEGMDLQIPSALASTMRNVTIISTIPVLLANAIESSSGLDPQRWTPAAVDLSSLTISNDLTDLQNTNFMWNGIRIRDVVGQAIEFSIDSLQFVPLLDPAFLEQGQLSCTAATPAPAPMPAPTPGPDDTPGENLFAGPLALQPLPIPLPLPLPIPSELIQEDEGLPILPSPVLADIDDSENDAPAPLPLPAALPSPLPEALPSPLPTALPSPIPAPAPLPVPAAVSTPAPVPAPIPAPEAPLQSPESLPMFVPISVPRPMVLPAPLPAEAVSSPVRADNPLDGLASNGNGINLIENPFTSIPVVPCDSVSTPAGDVNFDDEINVIDVISLISEILNKTPVELEALLCHSDINSDGIINIQDVLEILFLSLE